MYLNDQKFLTILGRLTILIQPIGLAICIIAALVTKNVFFLPLILIFLVTFAGLLIKPPKKAPASEEKQIDKHTENLPDDGINFKELENNLEGSVQNKLQIIPILTEQLRAVIAQTDEAAEGLSSAFMGISRQAKKQLQAVHGIFGNLSEQASSNNNLQTTQLSLKEIQTNFSLIISFFDKSIDYISDIATQLGRVDQFAKVITNIERTTDILAINAAIEAANLGEAGRGFKVIAAEIKELARNSGKSIKEIQEITSNLSTKINTIKEELGKVHIQAQSIASRTDTLFSETIGNLGETLQATAERMKVIAGDAEGLSKEIGHAVVSIQFQDITRQRIEHVITPLEQLKNELIETIDNVMKSKNDNSDSNISEMLLKNYTMESERETLKKLQGLNTV